MIASCLLTSPLLREWPWGSATRLCLTARKERRSQDAITVNLTPLSSSIYSSGPCPPRSGPSGWRDTARRDGGYEWVTWGTVRFIFSSHIRRHRASLTRLPSGPPSLTRYAAEPGSLALGGWIEGEPYRISCLSSVSSLPSPFPFLFERERRNRHDNKTFINVGF